MLIRKIRKDVMLKNIKQRLAVVMASLVLLFVPAISLTASVSAAAPCNDIATSVNKGIGYTSANGSQTCGGGGSISSGIQTIATRVVDVFSVVVGIASVIMIIYSGFRYITSGGESGSVSSAKNTLIYAIVGLIIVVLAQLIVTYVLNSANNVTNSFSVVIGRL